MPTLSKLPPSSLRPDLTLANQPVSRAGEARPYLVTGSYRRAEINSSRSSERAIRQQSVTLFPHESEDARLTGSTRSLFRRLLALNLPVYSSSGETVFTSAELRAASREKKFTA